MLTKVTRTAMLPFVLGSVLLVGCGSMSRHPAAIACRTPLLSSLAAEEAVKSTEDEKDMLYACKGKSAGEAYKAAKGTGYEPSFEDSYGVDVTGDVRAGFDAAKATVVKVDVVDEGWFWNASVTFTLDYVDAAAQTERDEKDALLQRLEDCKGKSASEAYETAEGTEYEPLFEDSYGVDVTDDVKSGGKASKAEVSKVDVTEKGWLWDAGVTFTLDYVDPTAQAERDEKAERLQKLESCDGTTAGEAYKVAKGTEYEVRFEDAYGTDVTSDVKAAAEAASAKVIEVKISEAGWFSNAKVTFTLEYVDPTAKAKRDEKAAADKKRDDEKKALNACEGMTASEAYKVGKDTTYSLQFEDVNGVDVTDDVVEEQDAAGATVKDVELLNFWFLGDEAHFTLDYEDPEAAAEIQKQEAEESARKALRAEIEGCEGKTVAEAYVLVSESGLEATFKDPYGNDMTKHVGDSAYEGARGRAVVSLVEIGRKDQIAFTTDRPLAISPEDNKDLKAVLQVKDEFDPLVVEFAERYEGLCIEFDGCFASIDLYGNRKSRYNVLVYAMDFDPDKAIGPLFQIHDVYLPNLPWKDEGVEAKYGMNVHIIARLGEYSSRNGLYEITPVELSVR